MPCVIPETDDGLIQVVVITENAHGGCSEIDAARLYGVQVEPPRGEHAQDVSVCKDGRIAADGADPVDDTIRQVHLRKVSAHARDAPDAARHFQLRISGMSSPCFSM